MNPGLLDRKFTLLRRTQEVDGAGAPFDTWKETVSLWAQLIQRSGSKIFESGALRATRSTTLRIRYRSDLETVSAPGAYRVRLNGVTYELTSAVEDVSEPRRAYQLLTLDHIEGAPTLKTT